MGIHALIPGIHVTKGAIHAIWEVLEGDKKNRNNKIAERRSRIIFNGNFYSILLVRRKRGDIFFLTE